jgi:hypothetical protein
MISLCTVILEPLERNFEKIFIDSVVGRLPKVSEVIIVKIDATNPWIAEWDIGNIHFIKIGYPLKIDYPNINIGPNDDSGIQHALGLHVGVDKAKNDYILLSDPDVFFYPKTDEFYLDLMTKKNLDLVGCSHHLAIDYACGYYPNQVNLLLKKSNLPDHTFLENKLYRRNSVKDENYINYKLPGKWLIPGPIPEYVDIFPNKKGLFETGCNLWILGQQRNWNWLSFQTLDCNLYTSLYHRGIKTEKIKKRKLIYHCTHSMYISLNLDLLELKIIQNDSMMAKSRYEKFVKEYELSKMDEDNQNAQAHGTEH